MPSELTSFVGRRHLLDRTMRLIAADKERLICLTGTGGVGKTRLAQRLAERAHAAGPVTRVVFVRLSDLRPGDDRLESVVAEALGVAANAATDQLSVIITHLQSERRPVLLILDNAEHMLDEVRQLVTTLLRATKAHTILVTSRRTLEVQGENLVPVAPLCTGEIPDCDSEPDDDGTIHEAVQLFVDRASAVAAPISDEDLPLIAEICQRLDGIPLAIELAAARLKHGKMTLPQLHTRVRSPLWLAGSVSDQDNHQTLAATLRTSYELLDDAGQRMWAALSVFEGGFDLAAAAAVCGDVPDGVDIGGVDTDRVADLLDELVDSTLLIAEAHQGRTRTRYRMLRTIQSYGREMADLAGRTEDLRAAHARYFAHLADISADQTLGPDEIDIIRTMHAEVPNLWRAFEYFLDNPRQVSRGRYLAINAHRTRFALFWAVLNLQGRMLTMAARDCAPDDPSELQVGALCMIACTSLLQGNQADATPVLERAETMAAQLGIQDEFAPLLYARGIWLWLVKQDRACYAAFDQAAVAFRRCSCLIDAWMVTLYKTVAGAFFGDRVRWAEDSEIILREARAAGARWCESLALWASALGELRFGDSGQAGLWAQEALEIQWSTEDRAGQIWSLWLLAMIAIAQGDHERGARLMGCTRRRQRSTQTSVLGLLPWLAFQLRYEGQARVTLGDKGFEQAVRAGQSMPSAEVRDLARESFTQRTKKKQSEGVLGVLSPREREVAHWVSKGCTNEQVATAMGTKKRTVDAQVSNILRKLSVPNRASIAAAYLADQPADSHA